MHLSMCIQIAEKLEMHLFIQTLEDPKLNSIQILLVKLFNIIVLVEQVFDHEYGYRSNEELKNQFEMQCIVSSQAVRTIFELRCVFFFVS